jgi:hypothetical protein
MLSERAISRPKLSRCVLNPLVWGIGVVHRRLHLTQKRHQFGTGLRHGLLGPIDQVPLIELVGRGVRQTLLACQRRIHRRAKGFVLAADVVVPQRVADRMVAPAMAGHLGQRQPEKFGTAVGGFLVGHRLARFEGAAPQASLGRRVRFLRSAVVAAR